MEKQKYLSLSLSNFKLIIQGIIEAIRDSLWFKAIDLQHCGLVEPISNDILELINHNSTLAIVDVRLNSALQNDSLAEIARRLDRNELNAKSEYRWLSLPAGKDPAKRVSSAGSLRKQKVDEPKATLSSSSSTRPRSAIIRQVKRPPPPVAYRKPLLPLAQIAKRIKTKPPVPTFERRPRQPMKPPEHARMPVPALVREKIIVFQNDIVDNNLVNFVGRSNAKSVIAPRSTITDLIVRRSYAKRRTSA